MICLASRNSRSAECEHERTCRTATLVPQGTGELTPAAERVHCGQTPLSRAGVASALVHNEFGNVVLPVLNRHPRSSATQKTWR